MSIRIEQTLHGYETGHQLLMSSTPLSSDAKQTLLVQSDLSGSNIDDNFKTYISGYPLASYYAFSKTWYAEEMRRPGCVWTQTLLIAFPDLGKIPDLEQLLQHFKRPVKDNYDEYSEPIFVEKSGLENKPNSFKMTLETTSLLNAVYDKYDKTIIFPAFSSSDHELTIMQLWSNQWPRLRRSFSFCSGALSLKSIGGREFDLQVVPRRNLLTVEKQTIKGYIIEKEYIIKEEEWISLLYNTSKNGLRRFLWLYGADVPGNRKCYRPLILIYAETLKANANFAYINKLVSETFDAPNDAIRLKNEIYSNINLFNFDQKDVLQYLLLADENELENLGQLNLSRRLLSAYNDSAITLQEFTNFYINAAPQRLSEDLWDNIISNESELLSLLSKDTRLLDRFSSKLPEMAGHEETWKLPFDVQLQIIHVLENSNYIEWERIIACMLSAKSDIIFDALKHDQQRVRFALKWLNLNNYDALKKLQDKIFHEFKKMFIDFARENWHLLSQQTCNKIFQNLNYSEINAIGFDASKWLTIYRKVSDERTKVFASCVLLSFGFNRKVGNPAGLVVGCFVDVYYYAKAAKVSGNEWDILPVDMSEEEEDNRDALTVFFNFINLFSPQKKDIPNWDYCELLTRTLVNKFIKYKWPNRAFLESLSTEHLTQQAVRYCLSFKKGLRFIKDLLSDIERKKIKAGKHQTDFLSQISKGLLK